VAADADPSPSDADLIRRFLDARDQTAFRELYRRHTPPIYGLLYRLTGGSDSDAADVMQDAWIRAARNLATFRGASQFRTWLTGIALNCFREWRRASQALVASPENAGEPAPPHDLRGDIERALQALPVHYREVLVLHDIEGYTHEDISGALGIEPGTSKSRLFRARYLFRRWWQSDGIFRG